MKRLALLTILGGMAMGCGGSGDNGSNYPGRLNPTPDAVNRATKELTTGRAKNVTVATNGFGFAIFQEIAKKEPNKNIFISPTSIAMALTMALSGAEAGTQTAMEKTLGLTGMPEREIKEAIKSIRTVLAAPDKGVTLDIANSLWAKQGVEFKREFMGSNEDYFGAKISTLDFSKEESADAINVWVNDATQEKIKSIVDKIPPEIVLYIINAVYFKGTWEDPFEAKATSVREFTPFDGKVKTVPMMHQTGEYEYQKAEKFAAVRLPYGTGRLGLYVLLPNEGVPLNDVVKLLTAKNWEAWLPKFKKTEGKIGIPKFKSEYSTSLNDALKALGMADAFDENKANFKGIAEAPPLFISNVGHKTFIEVNEEGTEAAAVTDIAVGATSAPITPKDTFELIANRPFAYLIVDRQTGATLFLGLMGDPA